MGDYIYARTYLELLKKNYLNYKIILLGTKRWKDFAIFYDKKYIDLFYFFKDPSKPKFKESFWLKFFKFDIFINVQPTNGWAKLNSLIKASTTYQRNLKKPFLTYQERTYELFSKLVNIPNDFQYKFDQIQSNKLSITSPEKIENDSMIDKKYVLIVLGGYAHGQFSSKQICEFIKHIVNQYGFKILLLGDSKDLNLYSEIINLLENKYKSFIQNGCNVYASFELPKIVDKSIFVITPNTSIFHMAFLLNKKCICASSNEINTIYIGAPNILYILNDELQKCIDNNKVYKPLNNPPKIKDFCTEKFINAINSIMK